MKKTRYIKACPFLRDLGDTFLCVCDDKVIEIILDPLIHIKWDDNLQPIATKAPNIDTCLFVLEIQDDERLFCVSRQMYLTMDDQEIKWSDIRDAIIFMNILSGTGEAEKSELECCSTCLYKVLLASSPAFQRRLADTEKLQLACGYIINKANEISNSIYDIVAFSNLEGKVPKKEIRIEKLICSLADEFAIEKTRSITPINVDEAIGLATSLFEWVRMFDEWRVFITRIADAESEEMKLRLIQKSLNNARKIRDVSFEILGIISYIKGEQESSANIKLIEKIIITAGGQFEDFSFICGQYLEEFKEIKW